MTSNIQGKSSHMLPNVTRIPTELHIFEFQFLVYILVCTLQILSLIGNGFLMLLFIKSSQLRESNPLKLFFVLSSTNLIFACLALPYTICHVSRWNQEKNFDAYLLMTFEVPIAIQYKFILIIILSIALDRFQENFYNKYYQQRDHLLFAILTILFGISMVIIDIILEFISIAAFKAHWSASNMALSFFGILITSLVSWKISKLNKTNDTQNGSKEEKIRWTNHLSTKIFIADMILIMLPCIITGIGGIFGAQELKDLGPFNVICLLFVGLINSLLYLTHKEIRNVTKEFLSGKGLRRENSVGISRGLYFIS